MRARPKAALYLAACMALVDYQAADALPGVSKDVAVFEWHG